MNAYSHDEIESILNQFGDMIYRMALIELKDRDLADDIYQEVCIRLLRQKEKILPVEHLKFWLLRTTINSCKDYWKSSWFQKISLKDHVEEEKAADSGRETTGYVTECVQKLPEQYRSLIHLYYYEGYSQKELSSLLGIKESTIASRLQRGRKKLKKLLEEGKENGYEFSGEL